MVGKTHSAPIMFSVKHFPCGSSFACIFTRPWFMIPVGDKTEAQRGQMSCPESHSGRCDIPTQSSSKAPVLPPSPLPVLRALTAKVSAAVFAPHVIG